MRLSDMVRDMKITKRRKLVGDIVKAEYARQRFTREQTADRAHMSPSTLDRVRDGDASVRSSTLRSVEGALGLPDDLLILHCRRRHCGHRGNRRE